MRGDRLIFTAFAIGYLGPKRAAKYILAGTGVALLFWIGMAFLMSTPHVEASVEYSRQEMISKWAIDKQRGVYLRSIGLCRSHSTYVPQCNN